jgi:hypothetical protein
MVALTEASDHEDVLRQVRLTQTQNALDRFLDNHLVKLSDECGRNEKNCAT